MSPRGARLLALGATVGATLRWLVLTNGPDTRFPWATLAVNLAGCALLGWYARRPLTDAGAQLAVTVGFCGGLTTFSTLAMELALLREVDTGVMWGYLLASVVGGTGAYLLTRSAPVRA